MTLCALTSLLLLAGCPTAPEGADPSTQPINAPSEGGPPPGEGPGGPGGPPSGEGGPPKGVNVAEMKHTQASLADTDAVSISGELICEVEAEYWVYLFPPPPKSSSPGEGAPLSAVAAVKIDKPGPFTFRAPRGQTGVLLAFQDLDADGMQEPGEPLFIGNDGHPLDLSEENSGLELDCEANAVGAGGDGPPKEGKSRDGKSKSPPPGK